MSNIVVTGGGTGGHLKVAKAFIDELKESGENIIFIGSKNGQDKNWFNDYENLDKSFFLDIYGVVNKSKLGKISSLLKIFYEAIKLIFLYKKYGIQKVISVGGYSAAPATFAAIFTPKCELYIHEQNSYMGKLNQMTAKYANEIFSSYLENSKIKDYPVSSEFFENARLRKEIKVVIFLGGSQGAVAINDFALKVAKKLDEMGIKIIHQTGKLDYKRVKKSYEKMNIDSDVFDFSTNLIDKMSQADFAVSRSGASTLWELTANLLPTLFVPYPYAAADHQYGNAKFLKDRNLCFLKRENELDEEFFYKILENNIENISASLKPLTSKNAIGKIVNKILDKK